MNSSTLTILVVVLLFGSSTFFRKLAVDGMSPYHLQVVASTIYMLLVPLWLWLAPVSSLPPLRSIFMASAAILTNVTGAVIFGFLLKRTTDVAVLSAMASTSPVVTAVLASAFLGESLTLMKAVGIGLVIAGAALCNR